MVIFLTHSSCLCISYIFIASMQTNVQRRYIQVSDFQNYVSAEIYIPRGDGVTQVLVIQNNHTGVIAKLFSFLGQELLFCLMGDTFSISSSKCITFGSQGIIFYIVVILFTLTLILILRKNFPMIFLFLDSSIYYTGMCFTLSIVYVCSLQQYLKVWDTCLLGNLEQCITTNSIIICLLLLYI